jgi:DNA helicase-2/ATP-dependent DNA helicase PcrA
MTDYKELKNLIAPNKQPDKQFFLDLLDVDKQRVYEDNHINAVMMMLKLIYIKRLQVKINDDKAEREELTNAPDYDAEKYRRVLELNAHIAENKQKLESFKCFFQEPYFARMDLVDDKDGYNSYYIGKHGDEGLEIVDWRAPLARKYYQKSQLRFSINEYNYKLIMRRALRALNGRVNDFQNEYLNVSDYLSKEEIGGRDEAVIFDPFLKDILNSRKEKQEICDIIETIQEKQYEIITAPERAEFIVQGVAGSGKTMIMLHRLSYLMYNNDEIKPSNVLVITPSDSFNAFIDELSQVLELEKVKTSTLDSYFIHLLKNEGVEMEGKIDYHMPLSEVYLSYVYSQKFVTDVEKKLAKIYDSVHGIVSSECSNEMVTNVLTLCDEQLKYYEKIKNAGLRVRRCVLGEIKEKPDGGLYYTKQMRTLFNCVLEVQEFLTINSSDERMKSYFYFYKQLLSFYKSIKFIRRYGEKICLTAIDDLKALGEVLDKEIYDLKRYKINVGGQETYTYPDRIEKRQTTKAEVVATIERVENILSRFTAIFEFADIIRGEGYLVQIGKCENTVDVARFFFREIVKKVKSRYGVSNKKLCKSDPYALCLILSKLGFTLSPKYSFVFVDEAQDISPAEYSILKYVNDNACFNVFGDLKQNITGYRGIYDWSQLGYEVYNLNRNYRNTNQIVEYVAGTLNIDMQTIGLGGDDVSFIQSKSISRFLAEKKGLRAIITSEDKLNDYTKKSYNLVRDTGRISKNKINVMTVYESKGLEFTAVAVVDSDMTDNERYIAYTRALKELAIVRDVEKPVGRSQEEGPLELTQV